MIYCVIPRELADELYDKMVDYYKDNPNVTVIVDRRAGKDRRSGEQQPTPDEIQKNFDATREQMLDQARSQAFSVFASDVINGYKKHNLIRMNAKAQNPAVPGE